MENVDKDTYQEFARFVNTHAGEHFRSAFKYTTDDWIPLYVRDDVATKKLEDSIPTLIDHARVHDPIIREDAYGRLGETQATVELHTDGVVLLFRESKKEGIIVSMDRHAARDLAEFIEECTTILNEF